MAADPDLHAPGIDPVHRLVRQGPGAADSGAEEGSVAAIAEVGGVDTGLQGVVRPSRQLTVPAPRVSHVAAPLGGNSLRPSLPTAADTRANVYSRKGDEGAVAQADQGRYIDAVEQLAGFVAFGDRRLALGDDMLRAADGGGGQTALSGFAGSRRAVNQRPKSVAREIRTLRSVGGGGG
jgi:hypothetical protein